MKRISLLLILVVGQRMLPGAPLQTGRDIFYGNTGLRLLLAKEIRHAEFASSQKVFFLQPENSNAWIRAGSKVEIEWEKGKLRATGGKTSLRVEALKIGSDDSSLTLFQGKYHRGNFQLFATAQGISVVNQLSLEPYLEGTVAAEMNANWPVEALKAQAVAARSYARYMIQHPRHKFYDLEATEDDQVYAVPQDKIKNVKLAVRATSGEVLVKGMTPIKALFHSRCGGETESAHLVWGGKAPTEARITCPYCRSHPQRWRLSLTMAELLEKLRLPFASDFSIKPRDKGRSGRLASLDLVTANDVVTIPAETLRNRLGFRNLKSTWFSVEQTGDRVAFYGQGAGHGVGMCQWGARYLAQQGKTYLEILKHYYPQYRVAR